MIRYVPEFRCMQSETRKSKLHFTLYMRVQKTSNGFYEYFMQHPILKKAYSHRNFNPISNENSQAHNYEYNE